MSIDSISQEYYVYTLAYPDGRVFYVGKGKDKHRLDRIDDHEKAAKRAAPITNARKIAVIKEIWASGGEVAKTKIAFFDNEIDAYIYEWGLINATCYSENLTNMLRAAQWPQERHKIDLPTLCEPVCIARGKSGLQRQHHQITNLYEFQQKTRINSGKLLDLVAGKINAYNGYFLLTCNHKAEEN